MTASAPPRSTETLLAAANDAVVRAQAVATELGPDSTRAWDLLSLAADVERSAANLEAELGAESP